MFTHDTKPDKTILIYSKHQLTLELSPLSEFRSLSEFGRSSSYTDSPFGSFWVNADMDLTLTSRPTSGTRQFVSIGSSTSVWPWWSANSFFMCQRVLKLFSSSAYFLNVIMTFVFLKELLNDLISRRDIQVGFKVKIKSSDQQDVYKTIKKVQNTIGTFSTWNRRSSFKNLTGLEI